MHLQLPAESIMSATIIGFLLTAFATFSPTTSERVSHSPVHAHNLAPASREEYTVEDNSTNIIWKNNVTEPAAVTCEVARIKCAIRQGCGTALQSYMLDCSDLLNGRIAHCDEFCKTSLIALTSTEEGASLMSCRCSDSFCEAAKGRLEVCRAEVERATAHNAVVSCSVAHLICSADTACSTALTYYDRFCRRMFSGKGCSFRCNNSISILERQTKAEKLSTCQCDGTEPFACHTIKANMAALCFHQKDEQAVQRAEEETNQIDGDGPQVSGNQGVTFQVIGIAHLIAMISIPWSGGYSDVVWLRVLSGLTLAMVVRWL